MKLQFIPDARRVLLRAWSAWLGLAAALFGSVEYYHAHLVQLLPIVQPYLKPGTALGLSMALGLMVPIARIVKQARLDFTRVPPAPTSSAPQGLMSGLVSAGVLDLNLAEPPWLTEARRHLAVREIAGAHHHPLILLMWKTIKRGGIKDDETPWCAAFVGFCLERVGITSTRFESARSYLTWGRPLKEPVLGCIVVLSREGGGHVGFLTGVTGDGRVLLLGGNQANEVNVRAFPRDRVTGFRWPLAVPLPEAAIGVGTAPTSTGEA